MSGRYDWGGLGSALEAARGAFSGREETDMRRRTVVVLGALLLSLVMALPAQAITKGGTLDGEDHPYDGLIVADDADGKPPGRCSGSMI